MLESFNTWIILKPSLLLIVILSPKVTVYLPLKTSVYSGTKSKALSTTIPVNKASKL